MTDTDTENVSLFPDEPFIKGRKGQTAAKFVRIADLEGYEDYTVRPTASFIRDVRNNGVLESIIVEKVGDHLFVKDGKRRVLASVECGFKVIAAVVIETANRTQGDVLTLSANMHRRPNPVAELKAIQSIMSEVGSAETVAKELGIPLNVLRRRLKVIRLIPAARAMFDSAAIPLSVAEEMSSLPTKAQTRLVEMAQAGDGEKPRKIRMKDVREARYAEQKTTADSLPEHLFADQVEATPDLGKLEPADIDTRVQRVRTFLLMESGIANPTLASVGEDQWVEVTKLAQKIVAVIDSVKTNEEVTE